MKKLTGTRTKVAPKTVTIDGVLYRDCPPWVPLAVARVVADGCIPSPVEIHWHPRPLKTLLGQCWPEQGRIHVHPFSGSQERVEERLDVDVSGEVRVAQSRRAVVSGQDEVELEDTLAHELAHLVHGPHGAMHDALTRHIAGLIRKARGTL